MAYPRRMTCTGARRLAGARPARVRGRRRHRRFRSTEERARRAFLYALVVAVAMMVGFVATSSAQEVFVAPDAPGCDRTELARAGATVGTITLNVGEIFDTTRPDEDRRLFRLANRLHIRTRDSVVRRQLLIAEGEPFSPRLVEESERVLRSTPYTYDARIRVAGCAGGSVDLEVFTRDVWTLTVGTSFGREGGENTFSFELQDKNFLGWGKDLSLEHRQDVERTIQRLRYRDLNLLGRWIRLEAWLEDNSDGHLRLVEIERPFYSLDTRRAAGLRVLDETRVDSLYTLGEVGRRFGHEIDFAEVFWGRSRGFDRGRALRLSFGATWDEHRFTEVEDGGGAPPEDRRLVYPWLGVELIRDGFVTVRNVDSIARTEDLNLAPRAAARLGLAGASFGSDRDAAIFSLSGSTGRNAGERGLVLADGSVSGRWGGGGFEDVIAGSRVRWYRRTFGRHLFFAAVELAAGSGLDAEVQLPLGGDSGLRGYPLRYQSGTRRTLLTLEQRFYTDWYPFRLAHLGAAVFLDVGKAWTPGTASASERGLLRDVGFGLRVASSRSSHGSMVHFDVAFPLDRADGIAAVQWLVSTKETF